MTWLKPGPGRPKGSKNAATLMTRENMLSAIEVCRQGGISPPEIMAEAARLIRSIALAPIANAKDVEMQRQALMQLPEEAKDRLVRRLNIAANIAHGLMEFGYPRLARQEVEQIGAPAAAQEDRVVIELKITDDRPTIEHMPTLGSADDDPYGAPMHDERKRGNGGSSGGNGGSTPPRH